MLGYVGCSTRCSQINVVAFYADYTKPIGAESLPPSEPWVETVSQEEMFKVFEGCGPQVMALLNCIKTPSKWAIHVVQPHLDTFVKGRVAVIGDAVCLHVAQLYMRQTEFIVAHRLMECCRTSARVQPKVSKMAMSWPSCSGTPRLPGTTLR